MSKESTSASKVGMKKKKKTTKERNSKEQIEREILVRLFRSDSILLRNTDRKSPWQKNYAIKENFEFVKEEETQITMWNVAERYAPTDVPIQRKADFYENILFVGLPTNVQQKLNSRSQILT